jgi:hypothetical protein
MGGWVLAAGARGQHAHPPPLPCCDACTCAAEGECVPSCSCTHTLDALVSCVLHRCWRSSLRGWRCRGWRRGAWPLEARPGRRGPPAQRQSGARQYRAGGCGSLLLHGGDGVGTDVSCGRGWIYVMSCAWLAAGWGLHLAVPRCVCGDWGDYVPRGRRGVAYHQCVAGCVLCSAGTKPTLYAAPTLACTPGGEGLSHQLCCQCMDCCLDPQVKALSCQPS